MNAGVNSQPPQAGQNLGQYTITATPQSPDRNHQASISTQPQLSHPSYSYQLPARIPSQPLAGSGGSVSQQPQAAWASSPTSASPNTAGVAATSSQQTYGAQSLNQVNIQAQDPGHFSQITSPASPTPVPLMQTQSAPPTPAQHTPHSQTPPSWRPVQQSQPPQSDGLAWESSSSSYRYSRPLPSRHISLPSISRKKTTTWLKQNVQPKINEVVKSPIVQNGMKEVSQAYRGTVTALKDEIAARSVLSASGYGQPVGSGQALPVGNAQPSNTALFMQGFLSDDPIASALFAATQQTLSARAGQQQGPAPAQQQPPVKRVARKPVPGSTAQHQMPTIAQQQVSNQQVQPTQQVPSTGSAIGSTLGNLLRMSLQPQGAEPIPMQAAPATGLGNAALFGSLLQTSMQAIAAVSGEQYDYGSSDQQQTWSFGNSEGVTQQDVTENLIMGLLGGSQESVQPAVEPSFDIQSASTMFSAPTSTEVAYSEPLASEAYGTSAAVDTAAPVAFEPPTSTTYEYQSTAIQPQENWTQTEFYQPEQVPLPYVPAEQPQFSLTFQDRDTEFIQNEITSQQQQGQNPYDQTLSQDCQIPSFQAQPHVSEEYQITITQEQPAAPLSAYNASETLAQSTLSHEYTPVIPETQTAPQQDFQSFKDPPIQEYQTLAVPDQAQPCPTTTETYDQIPSQQPAAQDNVLSNLASDLAQLEVNEDGPVDATNEPQDVTFDVAYDPDAYKTPIVNNAEGDAIHRSCPPRSLEYPATWYHFKGHPDFNICSYCFHKYCRSPISNEFESRSGEVGKTCHFRVPRIRSHLIPEYRKSGNIQPLISFAAQRAQISACKGAAGTLGTDKTKWFGTIAGDIAIMVCEACYEDVIHSSIFAHRFDVVVDPQGPADRWICSFGMPYIRRAYEVLSTNTDEASAWDQLRQAFDVRRGLPDCPDREFRATECRWYRPKELVENFDLCQTCYLDTLGMTPLGSHFEDTNEGFEEKLCMRACDGKLLPVSEMIWASRVRGLSIDTLLGGLRAIAGLPRCVAKTGIENGRFYNFAGGPASNYGVCEACYAGILTPYDLTPFFAVQPTAVAGSAFCAFNPSVDRFASFIHNFQQALDTGSWSHYEDYVRKYAYMPICPNFNLASERKWYGWEDLTICPECYQSVAESTSLVAQMTLKDQSIPGETLCNLYSPNMRTRYTTACQTRDLTTLLTYARHRRDIYNRTVPRFKVLAEMQAMQQGLAMSQMMLSSSLQSANAISSIGESSGELMGNSQLGWHETQWGVDGAKAWNDGQASFARAQGGLVEAQYLKDVWQAVE